MLNLRCFIACVLLLISKSQSIRVIGAERQTFLDNILRYYGENKSISTEDLDDFLLLISARRPESITDNNPLANQEVSTEPEWNGFIIDFLQCVTCSHAQFLRLTC